MDGESEGTMVKLKRSKPSVGLALSNATHVSSISPAAYSPILKVPKRMEILLTLVQQILLHSRVVTPLVSVFGSHVTEYWACIGKKDSGRDNGF
jgi:hypothetical protein